MKDRLLGLRRNKTPKMDDQERAARQGDENHLGFDRVNGIRTQFASWLLDPAIARQTDRGTVETHPTPEQAEHYKTLLLQGAQGLASGELRGAAVGELMVAAEMLCGTPMPDGRWIVMKDKALANQAGLVGMMAKSVAFMERSVPYQNEHGRMETSMYPGLEAQHEAVKIMNDNVAGLVAAYEGQEAGAQTRLGVGPEETAELINKVATRLNDSAMTQGVARGSVEHATGKMLFEEPVRTIGYYGDESGRTLAIDLPAYRDDRAVSFD